MAHSEGYVISKSSGKLLKKNGNSFDYWRGSKKGTISGEIEVFAGSNHREEAKKIHTLLKENNLVDRYFSVRIELK